ncbi:MAG TPA: hypothetical protein PKA24_06495 [Microthrixaceae bacterium]|nr:hypothetical protein [Microthrixaceae bacterium]
MTDPRRRLDHILARCDEAAQFGARGRDEFETDVILRHAAKSIIADIGEAAKNLDDLADQISLVPWTQLLAFATERLTGTSTSTTASCGTRSPPICRRVRRQRSWRVRRRRPSFVLSVRRTRDRGQEAPAMVSPHDLDAGVQ